MDNSQNIDNLEYIHEMRYENVLQIRPAMKMIIADLNKIFDSRVRLGIMAVLPVNDSHDYNALEILLQPS